MKISSIITSKSLGDCPVVYEDIATTDVLKNTPIQCVHAYCFYNNKLIVVYDPTPDRWGPPGGGVEKGESIEEAVVREVLEESNMRVIKQQIIGFQTITEPTKTVIQTRSVCIVEPIGPFVADPDGDITEIREIDPQEYTDYFNWGEVGEHVMKEALRIKKALE